MRKNNYSNVAIVTKCSVKFSLCLFQFEGGLYISALVVDGAYKLAEKAKKAPTISEVIALQQDHTELSPLKAFSPVKGAFVG